MPTECSAKPMGFARVDSRAVVADFDGGEITSNAGCTAPGSLDSRLHYAAHGRFWSSHL